jgi:hypothetical protein
MPAIATPCVAPTGLPPRRGPALRAYKKVAFYLEVPLWERLAQLARDEFRRVDDQAGYLVRLALSARSREGLGPSAPDAIPEPGPPDGAAELAGAC